MVKKILAIALALCAAAGWGVRVWLVNRDLPRPAVQVYEKGQAVPTGKDFFEKSTEIAEGYTVKVLSAALVPAKDFLVSYGENGNVLMKGVDYFYVVKVLFRNESNAQVEKEGISINSYSLDGTDYSLAVDDIGFKLAQPSLNGSLGFSLRQGTEMEFTLPFQVMSTVYTSTEHLRADPPKLLISRYPNRKMLKIQ